jgi:valyl-tRNA synthetase
MELKSHLKAYNHAATETYWQEVWEKRGAFISNPDAPGEPFKEISKLSSRLENTNFINKAPIEVVADCRTKLSEAQSQFNWSRWCLDQLN